MRYINTYKSFSRDLFKAPTNQLVHEWETGVSNRKILNLLSNSSKILTKYFLDKIFFGYIAGGTDAGVIYFSFAFSFPPISYNG
ncbi:hypothetical protein HI914_06742 [Erysiphe necator]|nr:hypothetical protein HI914_06742 [Erysiphe necator]